MRTDQPQRRRFRWLLVLGLLAMSGCTGANSTSSGDIKVELAVRPAPPKVGEATAVVTLADRDGQPVRGATVKLEGNMNHAGMKPVFADARETEPGRYEAPLEFTMGGDWFVLVSAALPDGRKTTEKIDVRGVKSE